MCLCVFEKLSELFCYLVISVDRLKKKEMFTHNRLYLYTRVHIHKEHKLLHKYGLPLINRAMTIKR